MRRRACDSMDRMSSVDTRSALVEALRTDLIGPSPGASLESEVLPQSPSRWYLTGFLVPLEANEQQKLEETSNEEIDELDDPGGTDDANAPDPPSARRAFLPSSIGMSLLVEEGTRSLRIVARWGDYKQERPRGDGGSTPTWRRKQQSAELEFDLSDTTSRPTELEIPDSGGLRLVLSIRPINVEHSIENLVPAGTRSVSVFLVNRRKPVEDEMRDEAFAFQAEIEVASDHPLVPRPSIAGMATADWDERVADLQYRDAYEFAVGHGIATKADIDSTGVCHTVRTCWIPSAEVERVAHTTMDGVEFSMERLAESASGSDATAKLGHLEASYREWIENQQEKIPDDSKNRTETAQELLKSAQFAADRIRRGIDALDDPHALEAFRIANRAMAVAARRRFGIMLGKEPDQVQPPAWRPFQLAFILMNLPGIIDPLDTDRETVDLLFFPTGGGKTEAYLGLAAFALVLRRLRNPGLSSAGVTVLMRYTLRLLTLDQLGRAATLVCALELEREKDIDKLGAWPFEIGLWVGRAATPNRMGRKGDGDTNSARAKTIAFQNDDRRPSPIPLEECPWCGEKFKSASFQLLPGPDQPIDLRVNCINRRCDFSRGRPLPILGVDEPIYRRLPCFLIATVDKFAAMPWTGPVGAFFGRVERADGSGFYGPCDPGRGRHLEQVLLPPELVIQDELHLISGPMGTMVGLYETALDGLCSRERDGTTIRPKIVASTATVRRADRQISALFCRRSVDIFPPPGPDRRDSFFAKMQTPEQSNARLYLGVAAQGRSLKVVLLRTYLALLGAAQKAYDAAGGSRNKDNPADPYMTLVGYFSSLRELGGSRRIIEDEVTTRLRGFGDRKRCDETEGLFADRKIAYEVVELTSRVSTSRVAEAKRRLALSFNEKGHVDVAIATNMISVGLDIVRLGLMVVLGQPKTSSEYIQATSRVGRDVDRPGLVVTLLNVHRARDRSYYERFAAYHRSFYRSVEATSVTPFSPRALDRGLAGTLVALARQGHKPMTPPKGAAEIVAERAALDFVVDALSQRAAGHAPLSQEDADALRQQVRDRAVDLLDEWSRIAADYQKDGVTLQYQEEVGGAQRLLYGFLDPELEVKPRHRKFRANRSMRDVEPNVNLWLRNLDDVEIEGVEE